MRIFAGTRQFRCNRVGHLADHRLPEDLRQHLLQHGAEVFEDAVRQRHRVVAAEHVCPERAVHARQAAARRVVQLDASRSRHLRTSRRQRRRPVLAPVFALGFGSNDLIRNSFRLGYLLDAQANPDGGWPTTTTGLIGRIARRAPAPGVEAERPAQLAAHRADAALRRQCGPDGLLVQHAIDAGLLGVTRAVAESGDRAGPGFPGFRRRSVLSCSRPSLRWRSRSRRQQPWHRVRRMTAPLRSRTRITPGCCRRSAWLR